MSYVNGDNYANYTYDVNGIRASKQAHITDALDITSKFIYDGNTLVAEQRNGEWIYYFYGVDGIAGFRYNNETYLYRKNIQGDVTHIYKQLFSGKLELVAQYVYDAWGNFHTQVNYYGIGTLNPFRYRGYYYDIETGLYYLQTRYYDPELGRFISADSIEYLDPTIVGGLNLYAYCGNNPVMRTDGAGSDWNSFWNDVGNWFKGNWDKILITVGVAVVTIGAALLTVATLGAAAPLLAAGITCGIGALGTNLISQGWEKGFDKIDPIELVIQTASGFAYGVASVLLPGVGGMLLKAGIMTVTSIGMDIYQKKSAGEIVFNAITSFCLSMLFQGIANTGLLDKLNISHWFGKGRWVDFVSDKVFDQSLIALDMGKYLIRELTVFGTTFLSRLARSIWKLIWR